MAKTVALGDIADEIRSKNAGPFELTFDVLFDDEETYRKVKASGVLTKRLIAGLYKLAQHQVRHLVWHDPARGVKITIDRPAVSGGPGDRDTYGGQQHAPLLQVEIPWGD